VEVTAQEGGRSPLTSPRGNRLVLGKRQQVVDRKKSKEEEETTK